jgi:hypothetical protein
MKLSIKVDRYALIHSGEDGVIQTQTSAMQITGGCLVRVTSRDIHSGSIAEAVTFVPGVIVADDGEGGYKLTGCVW